MPTVKKILVLVFVIHALLLAFSGWHQSPTLNEPGHLVAGLHHWRTGDFSLYRVNPPLVRLIGSLPSVLVGYQGDWSGYYEHVGARPIFEMAEDYVAANGRRSMLHFRLARWACIPFSLLGAWVCFAWARDLFGNAAGLMSAILWCFSPMILGHASMIAPDAHATSLGLAACYTFWRWLRKPTWRQAIVTGLVLGMAELSKTTMILFYPLWPLLWIAYRWRDRHHMAFLQWRAEAGMLIVRMLIGIYVLNIGYLGEGSFTQLKEFRFVSEMFAGETDSGTTNGNRFADSWMGELPVPFPSNYIIGIDIQQRDFEDFSRPSYLRGQYQAKGWWYYYAYAVLVKAPLGTLGLALLAIAITLFRSGPRLDRRDAMILLAPAIVIFLVVSSKTGFSHHSRYMLPCIPFIFIWISQSGDCIASAFGKKSNSPKASRATGLAAIMLLGWSVVSSLTVYPHNLSYFNQLAGGPKHGAKHLINSNLDWGQDLLFLEQWIKEQGIKAQPSAETASVHLAFYNYYNPFDLEIEGIESWPFVAANESDGTPAVPDGWYAISVNLLHEFPWPVRDRDGQRSIIDHRPLAFLRNEAPVGRAGYSIRIFSAEQVRSAYAAEESPKLWAGFED